MWWDDDEQKEILVEKRLFKYPDRTVMEIDGRPLAIADVLGDWREEIIVGLPGELRIYTSTSASGWRRPWLMDDRQYRLGVVAGSMGYYREPQLSTVLRPEFCPQESPGGEETSDRRQRSSGDFAQETEEIRRLRTGDGGDQETLKQEKRRSCVPFALPDRTSGAHDRLFSCFDVS